MELMHLENDRARAVTLLLLEGRSPQSISYLFNVTRERVNCLARNYITALHNLGEIDSEIKLKDIYENRKQIMDAVHRADESRR